MKTDFRKDTEKRKMYVTREFAGTVDQVWQAWTDPELLDQWWAPKPWKAVTKRMSFANGGEWLYYMQGPEGERSYAKATYSNIAPKKSFDMIDAFCDENGKENPDMPGMQWKNIFKQGGAGCIVEVEINFPSAEAMEQIIQMGFQEGFSAAHENLDRYLQSKMVQK